MIDEVRAFSAHFGESWQRRVGTWPTPALLSALVRDSVPVQPWREIVDAGGARHRIYAIYWHPDLDVVIKVDGCGVARQVLSRTNFEHRRKIRRRRP